MANVVVLAGGNSNEREISLLSGAAVAKALEAIGHTVQIVDSKDGLDKQLGSLKTADVVFSALHGTGGEDGKIQHLLEQHGILFVGSSSVASELCFDKYRYCKLLKQNNILVPKTEIVDSIGFEQSVLSNAPFVLKPNQGGSSVDTLIIRDMEKLDTKAIEKVFHTHKTMMLQELVDGHEITVGVLGNQSLSVVEIIPPEGAEFDYENKYNGKTQELCPPHNVSAPLQAQAQALTLAIHKLTGCQDMSRTDIIVNPLGQLIVLETNTIPGLTDQSLLPKTAAHDGVSMPKLCDHLVKSALARA